MQLRVLPLNSQTYRDDTDLTGQRRFAQQILMSIGAVLYVAWHFYYRDTAHVFNDPLSERLAFAFLALGSVALSLKVPFFRERFDVVYGIHAAVLFMHFASVVYRMNFQSEYVAGFIVLATATAAAMFSRTHLIIYSLAMLGFLVAFRAQLPITLSLVALGWITIMSVFYMVTSLQEAILEANLREKSRFRLLVQKAPVGIVQHDRNNKIVAFNEQALALLGLTPDQIQGKDSMDPSWHVIDEDENSFPGEKHPAHRVMVEKVEVNNVVMGVRSGIDGHTSWIQVNAVPLFRHGKFDGCLVSFVDLTKRFEAEKDLESTRAMAAETARLAAVGEMAGGVAHEVNNPLAIIQGKAELMLNAIKSQRHKEADIVAGLETIIRTSQRITKIIRGLLNLSRGQSSDNFESLPYTQILEDTLGLCREKFKNHGIDFVVNAAEPDWMVTCKPVQIVQVLTNLLNNAYDAIQSSEPKWIRLESSRIGDELEIRVTDSGPGVPVDLRGRIFQPFFTTKGVGKGTGIGLSVSKTMVEENRGRLYLDEENPSSFVLRLPSYLRQQKAG